MTRRELLAAALAAPLAAQSPEPIIDIHQHTPYTGRTDAELVRHQQVMGATLSILLPAARKYALAAGAGGNDTCVNLARQYPDRFKFFANEAPDVPECRAVLEKYLKMGAIGIGEQKFPLDCDSPEIHRVAEIARDYRVPVLLHFEHNTYNLGFNRFYRILEKYPTVNFIGHAQTWWGNIDAALNQEILYPQTKVTPGGITDRYLSNYPNMYGDMSAGSGLRAFLRDEEHGRAFLGRHQDKLLFGSDCSDRKGEGDLCIGTNQIASIRRLSPSKAVERKILYENSKKLFRL